MKYQLILAGIKVASELVDNLVLQARIAKENGDITPEQLENIELAGVESDKQRNARIEAARQRLAGGV